MRTQFTVFIAITALVVGCGTSPPTGIDQAVIDQPAQFAAKPANGNGFDQFGYNYNARLFNGPADGVDKKLDGTVWGDATYGRDRLKMTWSKGWDDARFNGALWGPDAWEDNQWNGALRGGSGETWHYKIVWVGPELENGPYWRDGGYAIWGQFEVILSHGTVRDAEGVVRHIWETHADPAGYGANTN